MSFDELVVRPQLHGNTVTCHGVVPVNYYCFVISADELNSDGTITVGFFVNLEGLRTPEIEYTIYYSIVGFNSEYVSFAQLEVNGLEVQSTMQTDRDSDPLTPDKPPIHNSDMLFGVSYFSINNSQSSDPLVSLEFYADSLTYQNGKAVIALNASAETQNDRRVQYDVGGVAFAFTHAKETDLVSNTDVIHNGLYSSEEYHETDFVDCSLGSNRNYTCINR